MSDSDPTLDSPLRLQKSLGPYLAEIKTRTKEEPRKILFADFLREVFQVEIKDFSRLMEKFVKSKALLVRGHMDAVFGSLVFEFKSNLKSSLDEAKEELTKYLQALREKEPTNNYLGVATDGIEFRVFKPVFDAEEVIRDLKQIDSISLDARGDANTVYLWFDSYLFSAKQIAPTTEDLKRRFGVESPTYAFLREELMNVLEYLKDEKTVRLKRSSWSRYLEIAYGTSIGSADLFVKHTYLATLAKLFIFEKLEQGRIPSRKEIPEVLDGTSFRKAGITNLVDEDFFTWILHPRVSHRVANLIVALLKQLGTYDLTQITEDIFKELYQELVDPDIRHDLGEYYTPDWMAQYIVNKLLDENPERSVIDPSCGSGTFLFVFLREAKKRLSTKDKKDLLQHLLDSAVGIDIHPLAVTIARTNFLLAIQELLPDRTGPITIPIYLSDAIRLPPASTEIELGIAYYKIMVDETRFLALPERVVKQRWILDQVAQRMYEVSKSYQSGLAKEGEAMNSFSNSLSDIWSFAAGDEKLLVDNMRLLLRLIDEDSNSIWTFIIRNIYQPIALATRKFDTVVGNPPWLVLRQISNPGYQQFLKSETKAFGLLDAKQTHLFPHLEIATVFWCKCATLYLKEGGKIAFVLPRSVLVAQHHAKFLKFAKPRAQLVAVLDFDQVRPHKIVFNVPSCALIAEVGPRLKSTFPVPREEFRGVLSRRNASLKEALQTLDVQVGSFTPQLSSRRSSPYADEFFQGATIVPRSFWFVRPVQHPTFGIDPKNPHLVSDSSLQQKKPWVGVRLEGTSESRFLFGTLLSGDLVPFGFTEFRPVVLPLVLNEDLEFLESSSDARNRGFSGLADWLGQVEAYWDKRATAKSKTGGPYEWLNYRNKVTDQKPASRFKVLYTASSTDLTACVVDLSEPIKTKFDGVEIPLTSFVAESKTYWFDTEREDEAHYLSAILNSSYVNQAIKESQTKGLWGPRDIHKRPLSIPFGRYLKSNPDFLRLSRLGRSASIKALAAIPSTTKYKSAARKRAVVRATVSEELEEIDEILLRVLGDPKVK